MKDSNGCPIFEVEIKESETYFCDFIIYKAISWEIDNSDIYEKKFIAEVHWKWDFCTHWCFFGEHYKIIEDGYDNLEIECSVDMSVDRDEETYMNRIFGKDLYNVRYDVVRDLDGTEISRKV